ncbi:MAG: thioredoxin domain-containing protein [Magnetococcales bacterium]|nr:thioredoxin domain-containing protein [Magnetococcales bacterium]
MDRNEWVKSLAVCRWMIAIVVILTGVMVSGEAEASVSDRAPSRDHALSPRSNDIDVGDAVLPDNNSPERSPERQGGFRLENTASAYLRKHADNPVNWYPWGEEALQKARSGNRLIMVSIGYASCHWCHVMERESFSDAATADVLNHAFVSIKIDRDERPDLDHTFMQMAKRMIGHGGWPLHLFLTPELQPIFAGVYFPPETRRGQPSFRRVLSSLALSWRDSPDVVRQDAARLGALLSRFDQEHVKLPGLMKPSETEDPADRAVAFWIARFDAENGGFGLEPKFPQPSVLGLLIRQARKTDDPLLREMVEASLIRMASGGVRDQLGGGFHRYAVDRRWDLPHFEMMLTDNAQLAEVYRQGALLTDNPYLAEVARGVLDTLLKRFRLEHGCFASSLDAESTVPGKEEKSEGIYYTWTEEELVSQLGEDHAGRFIESFFDPFAQSVEGRYALRRDPKQVLEELEQPLTPEQKALRDSAIKTLNEARDQRPPPFRDEAVITSLNALTVTALIRAEAQFPGLGYREAALRCADTLWQWSRSESGVRHSRFEGVMSGAVFLEDYATLIWAMLDLYDGTFDQIWLKRALELTTETMRRFRPSEQKSEENSSEQAYPMLPRDVEQVLPVTTRLEDDPVPSGNSVLLAALRRLAWYTGEESEIMREAKRLMALHLPLLRTEGWRLPAMLHAWDFSTDHFWELVIAGDQQEPEVQAFLKVMHARLLPGRILILADGDGDEALFPALNPRQRLENKPTAYLCSQGVCHLPVTSAQALSDLLDRLLTARNKPLPIHSDQP